MRGNGTPYPHQLGGRFLVQASCLYPLQPASFAQLQGGKKIHVTPLYPVTTQLETGNGNGHVPIQEQQQVEKPTKAVATTRLKKAAPTRRVVRKNAKQAQ